MSLTTLALASEKGGVGKTTLTLNLSYALAKRGWKTLVVDTDPQGGIASSTHQKLRAHRGLVGVIAGDTTVAEDMVVTREPQLALLPVGPVGVSMIWFEQLANGDAIRAFLDTVPDDFDIVIFDTPPGANGATLGVLRACQHVISPLQAEPLAARSIPSFLKLLGALRGSGEAARLAGFVLTMLQSRNEDSLGVAQESWRLLEEQYVFDSAVPRDPAFLAASTAGAPLALLRKRPPAVAAIFDQLAAEVETRLGMELEEESGAIPLLD
ncbi:MAG: ParA family protein [Acidobacteriota bacterium]